MNYCKTITCANFLLLNVTFDTIVSGSQQKAYTAGRLKPPIETATLESQSCRRGWKVAAEGEFFLQVLAAVCKTKLLLS
jgi:hypothetical protein